MTHLFTLMSLQLAWLIISLNIKYILKIVFAIDFHCMDKKKKENF